MLDRRGTRRKMIPLITVIDQLAVSWMLLISYFLILISDTNRSYSSSSKRCSERSDFIWTWKCVSIFFHALQNYHLSLGCKFKTAIPFCEQLRERQIKIYIMQIKFDIMILISGQQDNLYLVF